MPNTEDDFSNYVAGGVTESANGGSQDDSFGNGANDAPSIEGSGPLSCSNWDSFLVAMFVVALVVLIFATIMFAENHQGRCFVGLTSKEASKKLRSNNKLILEESMESSPDEIDENEVVATAENAGAKGPSDKQLPPADVVDSPEMTELHVKEAEENAKVAEGNVEATSKLATAVVKDLAVGDEAAAAVKIKAVEVTAKNTEAAAQKSAESAANASVTSSSDQKPKVQKAKQAAQKAKNAAALAKHVEVVVKAKVQESHPNLCPAWNSDALAEQEMIAKLNGHDDNDFDVPRSDKTLQERMDESYLEAVIRGIDNSR